jgi:hypothetical protein
MDRFLSSILPRILSRVLSRSILSRSTLSRSLLPRTSAVPGVVGRRVQRGARRVGGALRGPPRRGEGGGTTAPFLPPRNGAADRFPSPPVDSDGGQDPAARFSSEQELGST